MTPEAATLELAKLVLERERLRNQRTILRSALQYAVDEIRLWEPSEPRDDRLLAVCQAALDETEAPE